MALRHGVTRAVLVITLTSVAGAALAQSLQLGGTPCARPPVLHCPDKDCPSDRIINQGPVCQRLSSQLPNPKPIRIATPKNSPR